MKLADYEALVSGVENGKISGPAEVVQVRLMTISRECRQSAWRTEKLRSEALEVAARAEAIISQLQS